MASTLYSGTADERNPAISSVPPFRRCRIPARLGDHRPATSSITRNGSRSASHVSIASERGGLGLCNLSWAVNNLTELLASGRLLAWPAVAARSVSRESQMRRTRLGYDPQYSQAGRYWHVLAQSALNTDWWSLERLTACMTAGCVPASQSKRRERLERPLDQAGARRAPICLHDSIHPRQEREVGGLDEDMSPGLGLGGADEWRAFAGSPLISVRAPDQTETSSTGSYDCQAASDEKEVDPFPTASLPLGSWRHHSSVSGRVLVGYVLTVLSHSGA
ncbi:hypothetical protein BU23DRAFT_69781 [Bimuria novae-zelandiae CBS 107.79]|uniref:Uncharacterized protein n=1 Tax=Bimuria novae-zelandiae CBS 107.79 TaxID=1447943 RepID=A0A6A5VFD5_9PLEO|nr:hypothetical protein BU23DRAFT_69781 [Bimuria novae-zelandiae CBS 107.79]